VDRLSALGLSADLLRDAILAGELARSSCTDNDPPALGGILGWGRTVRALRERTITLGWRRSEAGRLSTTVHPSGDLAVAVATGDEGTGLADGHPRTKHPKGPATAAAVERNQLSLPGFEPEPGPTGEVTSLGPAAVTWLLLIARTGPEVRCELSLPGRIGEDDRVEEWRERIILEPVQVGPTPDLQKLEAPADVDVLVERRVS
jgi:hypothetical protein